MAKKILTLVFSVIFFLVIAFASHGDVAVASDLNRYEKGYKLIADLASREYVDDNLIKELSDIAPDLANFVIEFAYGDVVSRPGLDIKSREIATVSALAALGNAQPQLKWHIGAALQAGVTPDQIIETLYEVTVFHGFPAGLNGIAGARQAFKDKGIVYKPVRQYNPKDRHVRGIEIMDKTSKGAGLAVIKSLKDIAPDMADFIIDFAYADVFSRTGITHQVREIACIASMAAVGTQRPQLKVHIKTALNLGVTKKEIVETLMQMAVYAGFPAALNAINAAREAFAEYK